MTSCCASPAGPNTFGHLKYFSPTVKPCDSASLTPTYAPCPSTYYTLCSEVEADDGIVTCGEWMSQPTVQTEFVDSCWFWNTNRVSSGVVIHWPIALEYLRADGAVCSQNWCKLLNSSSGSILITCFQHGRYSNAKEKGQSPAKLP